MTQYQLNLQYRLPLFAATLLLFILAACDAPRKAVGTPAPRPKPTQPNRNEPIDTVRWSATPGKPPIKTNPGKPDNPSTGTATTYHIGYLLPFLTNQAAAGATVPEKSRLALQFYAGAKIALEEISTEEKISLVVDVWDTQAGDTDFQSLLNTASRIQKPSVFIGPIRNSHLDIFADWAKTRHKILISPESPNADIAVQNPDFIQINPSLRAHCAAITRYVRKSNASDAVTLVCKQKESDRLPYFHDANRSLGGSGRFNELIMPDDALNFDKTDLKHYLKAGKTSVFILPSWASQDFVMAFLRRLKEQKGSNRVEVYGMPQWQNFEAIEAEYFSALNVHISSAEHLDFNSDRVKAFQEKFYEATGTIPDEDAFNGYDVTRFTGRMLARYGLSFPGRLDKEPFDGLRAMFRFNKVYTSGGGLDAADAQPDYWENTNVEILQFGKSGFAPAPK